VEEINSENQNKQTLKVSINISWGEKILVYICGEEWREWESNPWDERNLLLVCLRDWEAQKLNWVWELGCLQTQFLRNI